MYLTSCTYLKEKTIKGKMKWKNFALLVYRSHVVRIQRDRDICPLESPLKLAEEQWSHACIIAGFYTLAYIRMDGLSGKCYINNSLEFRI